MKDEFQRYLRETIYMPEAQIDRVVGAYRQCLSLLGERVHLHEARMQGIFASNHIGEDGAYRWSTVHFFTDRVIFQAACFQPVERIDVIPLTGRVDWIWIDRTDFDLAWEYSEDRLDNYRASRLSATALLANSSIALSASRANCFQLREVLARFILPSMR